LISKIKVKFNEETRQKRQGEELMIGRDRMGRKNNQTRRIKTKAKEKEK